MPKKSTLMASVSALALVVASALLQPRIPLSLDEVYSLRVTRLTPVEVIQMQVNDVSPPLYFLLLDLVLWPFPTNWGSDVARLLSAVFIAAAVFSWGVLLGRHREEWSYAAPVLALSTAVFMNGNNIRMYSLLLFLTTLSWGLALRTWKDGTTRSAWPWAFAAALLPLVHNWGLFVLFAQLLWIFYTHGKNALRSFWGPAVLSIVPSLVWLPVILLQIGKGQNAWVPPPRLAFLWQGISISFFGKQLSGLGVSAVTALALLLATLIVAAILIVLTSRSTADGFPLGSLVIAGFLPLFMGFFGSYITPMYIPERYDIVVYPFAAHLLVALVFGFRPKPGPGWVVLHSIGKGLVIVCVVVRGYEVAQNYTVRYPLPFKKLLAPVDTIATTSPFVVASYADFEPTQYVLWEQGPDTLDAVFGPEQDGLQESEQTACFPRFGPAPTDSPESVKAFWKTEYERFGDRLAAAQPTEIFLVSDLSEPAVMRLVNLLSDSLGRPLVLSPQARRRLFVWRDTQNLDHAITTLRTLP